MKIALAIQLLVAFLYTFNCYAVSFDCKKAASPSEKAICGDSQLSNLDTLLVEAYKKVLATSTNSNAIRKGQRDWLAERNTCLGNVDCLKQSYNERLSYLRSSDMQEKSAESGHTDSKTNQIDFPLSVRGWQATIVKLSGVDSSEAMAMGQVKRNNAEEYCERDPGGETIENGGKLTKEQCVQKVLKEEKGKTYSISANCSRKIITTSGLGVFSLKGKATNAIGYLDYVWFDIQSGEILDGSSASGAPVVEEQFRILCPSYIEDRE